MEKFEQTHLSTQPIRVKRLSWTAILAGMIVAIIVQILLSLLGLGIGLTAFSPATDSQPFQGLGTGAGIWWIISVLLSLFSGGWVAGWLAHSYNQTDNILHGVLTWGLFTLISLYLLTSSIGSVIDGLGNVVGKGLSSAGSVVKNVAPDISNVVGSQIGIDNEDLQKLKEEAMAILKETDKEGLQPNQVENELNQAKDAVKDYAGDVAEDPTIAGERSKELMNKLFSLKENVLSDVDKDALVNVVAQRTGKSKDEAKETVDNWINAAEKVKVQAKEVAEKTVEQVKSISDDASDAVGKAAIWGFFALLIGACASIGGSIVANKKRQSLYGNTH